MSRVKNRAEEMISRHGFQGVPVESFEDGGRRQLIALLEEGLNPESKVLDLGCGCLRAGYWLIHFLAAAGYHGIEPARQRVDHGLRFLFTREEVEEKRPRFDFNPDFDSSVFGTRFDFFLAGSVWTHAGKRQIGATLDAFARDSTPAGVFLATYLPARFPAEDYHGERWVGTSHESNTPGVIRHSLPSIVELCGRRGLGVEERPGPACDDQSWLRVRHH